jgi:hypothetical protein
MNMTDIQRPLSSNDLGDPWLLYDKNRSHVEQRTEGSSTSNSKPRWETLRRDISKPSGRAEGRKIGDKVLAEDW